MEKIRRPKGYVGTNHETIGSDIVSVLRVIKLPDIILGQKLAESLRQTDPGKWYPMQMLVEPVELLHDKMGDAALHQVGVELFRLSHAEAVKKVAFSARDILFSLDDMYHRANRGREIGGWNVIKFEAGKAVVEKTTPYNCILEKGILQEALSTVGVHVNMTQEKCFRRGDTCCEFVISSFTRDKRWMGKPTG